MNPPSQPLRDEHLALLPELSSVRDAADVIGTATAGEHTRRALRLLERLLYPHMAAEDEVLYPAIDRIMGCEATATMRRDHDEIRRRTAQLQATVSTEFDQDSELRSAWYGLDAIIHLHMAKEEELYYPILDRHLDGPATAELVAAMHRAARQHYSDER